MPNDRHATCMKCRASAGKAKDNKTCSCGVVINRQSEACVDCMAYPLRKGGKTKHQKGYIMVMMPTHPRLAHTQRKYVFEHILVMEDHLNRYLLPGENVHHKNGVRDDNRIENLELWTKPQPSGVRAFDLYIWAKSIVARYESQFEKDSAA